MKIQIDRKGGTLPEDIQCEKVEIQIGDSRFELREHLGQLVVNKAGLLDNAIHVLPQYANQIGVK